MNFMPPQCCPDPVVIPPHSSISAMPEIFCAKKGPPGNFTYLTGPYPFAGIPPYASSYPLGISRPYITRLSGTPLSDSPAFPGAFLPQCLILLSEIPRVYSSAYRPSPHRQSICNGLNLSRHAPKRIGGFHTLNGHRTAPAPRKAWRTPRSSTAAPHGNRPPRSGPPG